jgi:TolB-like protein
MNPDRWHQVERLYHQALSQDPANREAFLDEACADDPELRRELASLLAEETEAANFIESPAIDVAARACGGDKELRHELESMLSADTAEDVFVQAADAEAVEENPDDQDDGSSLIGQRLGPYLITRLVGRGGMGIVYEAHDERLDRRVALKTLRTSMNATAQRRLLREARVAAGINHPGICQLYDVGEYAGRLYLAMELLEGESLAERIRRGPLSTAEAVQITLGILAGLEALHRGLLAHRDLKPSNIVLTPHGIKLLDFGLTRPILAPTTAETLSAAITQTGMVVGTPAYMAPEQLTGGKPDRRVDLFALGAILFEMLTGRRAFSSKNMIEVFHAVLYEQPPALSGSAAVSAVDLIVRKALAKNPDERYQSAHAMAEDLRAALLREDTGMPAHARAMMRLMVLPFRLLRADAEIDWLGFGLADAITNALSGLSALVVRSSLSASRYAGLSPDLKLIAAEAEVDAVLTGTLLRSGDQLRVSTQLAEAPGGAVIWTQTTQLPLREIFQLQDELVRRVVESLAVPLTALESRLLRHDVPASAASYEFYLRANQLAADWQHTTIARDLYLQCLEQDSRYAPAWARLGRCYRLLAKYSGDEEDFVRAEKALQRALDLNSDLNLAHNLFAHLEADLGRAPEAMVRLLGRARANGNDPNVFAGLVYVCRFCGLLNASIAAHRHARRLDPLIPTSVTHSYFMSGDYKEAIDSSAGDIGYIDALAMASLGREGDALKLLRQREQSQILHPLIRWYLVSLRTVLEGNCMECVEAADRIFAHIRRGGEELYYPVRNLAYAGEAGRALTGLERVVDLGYHNYPALLHDPWLDSLRSDPRFTVVLQEVQSRHRVARHMFVEAGGVEILGCR